MLYHTSPVEITQIHKHGLFDDCLFFSVEPYSMGDVKITYSIDDSEMSFIRASQLFDESIIAEISCDLEIDAETAEELLQARQQVWNLDMDCDKAEADWKLQALRGKCAKVMGYDGCIDRDEQGAVYIIPMFGRESILLRVNAE